jgi:hypothetical protein
MDFAINDEVVYNPNFPDLAPPEQRPRDWGRIAAIANGYLHIQKYDYPFHNEFSRCLPSCITHSPRSHKYFKNIYAHVVKSVKQEAITVKYKQIHRRILSDIRNYGYEKTHQDLLRSSEEGSQSFFSALDATV